MLRKILYPFFATMMLIGPLNFQQATPPANDHFANAAVLTAALLPTTVDISAATIEPDEPQYCNAMERTVWYTFSPASTMHLRADTAGGIPATVNIYTSAGPGLTGLQFQDCASPNNPVTFQAEAGKTYYFQAGPAFGDTGTLSFSLSEPVTITGRVTEAGTGAPLPGDSPPFALVTLHRACGEECMEFVSSQGADSQGMFVFDNDAGNPLPAGIYWIEVSATPYQTMQFGPFDFSGADLDVGDLRLEPLPSIRSIRGRLLDGVTSQPISQTFVPVVELYRCAEGSCSELVNSQAPDDQGHFHFETDSAGNRLSTGTYQIVATADQYQPGQSKLVEAGDGADQTIGSLRLRSLPARFSDVVPCPDVPASGGDCAFSVRVWNGLPARLDGEVWSMVNTALADTLVGFTEFQVRDQPRLNLERGKSKVFHFRFKVPANDAASETAFCPRVFVGRGSNAFVNTIGFAELFCITRSADGMALTTMEDSALAEAGVSVSAPTGIEEEPNNSCQAAQVVSDATFPFTLDGNLESSQTPDVDFYRFTAAPGFALAIDLEGWATGNGTLVDPLLGVFDSNCSLLAYNDDNITRNSRLTIVVPEGGVFIVAATEFPDTGFVGGGNGIYQLRLTALQPIGAIHGTVTDAETGMPLTGDEIPFAFVHLLQCNEFGCLNVSGQSPASDGSFYFDRDFNGAPLGAGNYAVYVFADQYQVAQTAQFTVAEGEQVDVGNMALTAFPIHFSNIRQNCSEISSEGGFCDFTVDITNRLPTRFSGKAWSIVEASQIGSFIDYTSFQVDAPLDVRLDAGESRTLHFRFRIRGAVSDGAEFCPRVYAGQNPDPYFSTMGQSLLFCFVKGGTELMLMSTQDSQETSQQMHIEEVQPGPLFNEKEK
ncbi:MAG TPA: hypothetical protein VK897_14645 [Anaerolineales bacterium]|nr:hypothetical protein [Anaerolineales bacterium]